MGSCRPIGLSNSEIADLYYAGRSVSEIALICRAPFPVIKDILLQMQVRLRSRSEANALGQEARRQRRARIRARRGG